MNIRLVIIGASDFGRELEAWVLSSPRLQKNLGLREITFLDDSKPGILPENPILGNIADYRPEPDDRLICAIADSSTRKRIVRDLTSRGARFTSIVHDSVIVGPRSTFGVGTVLCPNVIVSTDVVLGEHVHVNISSTLGHDVHIGAFSTLSSACQLTGGVTLGESVFVGTAAVVTPKVEIEEGARVGAGSVVLQRVKKETTVFGNPARVIAIGAKT